MLFFWDGLVWSNARQKPRNAGDKAWINKWIE